MTDTTTAERSTTMNLIDEDLTRAHRDRRPGETDELRLARRLPRARRLTRRVDRVAQRARLVIARSL